MIRLRRKLLLVPFLKQRNRIEWKSARTTALIFVERNSFGVGVRQQVGYSFMIGETVHGFFRGVRTGRNRVHPREAMKLPRDVFPSTYQSWITRKLAEGPAARLELSRHIMDVYARALEIYFCGCADRWLGEPQEVVAGFFADRLAREDFLSDWQQSGLRLRRWLMNAFSFYLAELRRTKRRDAQVSAIPTDRPAATRSPHDEVDRAFVEVVIHEALRIAQCQCADQGLEQHWGVFFRHYYEGQPYDSVGLEFGVAPSRAAVMSRTAARRFRQALRDLLGRDGVPPEQIDEEIRSLLEVVAS